MILRIYLYCSTNGTKSAGDRHIGMGLQLSAGQEREDTDGVSQAALRFVAKSKSTLLPMSFNIFRPFHVFNHWPITIQYWLQKVLSGKYMTSPTSTKIEGSDPDRSTKEVFECFKPFFL